jgi:4-hydroxy-tetrahydrodipicolinate synthase
MFERKVAAMKDIVFAGAATALVTPFTGDFVDFVKLGELIDWQIESGINALVICGTTGEASTQTIPEHLATIEYAVKKANGRVPVIAGTGSNDTAHALMMSQSAEKSGASALLMVTPYYNKATQKGLVAHYNYVADRVHIPIMLYNVPSRTGLSFTAETYKELSKHPLIVGVKEASGNMNLVAQTRHLCGDDFNIWCGNDSDTVSMMALGALGVISVLSNLVPKEVSEIAKLWIDGDIKGSADLQIKYQELIDSLFCEVNPIPVKTAMKLIGRDSGPLRMPLCEMSPANLARLKKALAEVGLATE